MNLEAPRDLPVNLSHSSIETYLKCPEKWRRRYIDNEYEPAVGIMVVGRAVHHAEGQSYQEQVVTGEPHSMEKVLDEYSTSFDNEDERGVDWQDDSPGTLKDRGAKMLSHYHRIIPHNVKPIKVEHEFKIHLPQCNWHVKGFIDVIGSYDDGGLTMYPIGAHDIKTVKKAIPQTDLDASPQATLYTYATMEAEEQDRPFLVHQLKTTGADLLTTTRTREMGERYMERVAKVAREIEWRMQSGEWQGAAPNAWWCRAKSCGYHATCPMATRP